MFENHSQTMYTVKVLFFFPFFKLNTKMELSNVRMTSPQLLEMLPLKHIWIKSHTKPKRKDAYDHVQFS